MPVGQAEVIKSEAGWIPNIIEDILRRIEDIIRRVYDALNNGVSRLVHEIQSRVNDAVSHITAALSDIFSAFTDTIGRVLQTIIDRIDSWVDYLYDVFTAFAQSIISLFEFVISKVESVISTIIARFEALVDGVRNAVRSALEFVGEKIELVVNTVRSWLEQVIVFIAERIENVYERVSSFLTHVFNTVREKIERAVNVVYETVTTWTGRIWTYLTDLVERARQWITQTWEKVEKVFREIAIRVLTFLQDALGRAIIGANAVKEIAELIWSHIARGDYGTALRIVDDVFKGIGLPAPIQIIRSVVSLIAYFWFTVHVQFTPLEMAAHKRATHMIRPGGLSPETLAWAVHLGVVGMGEFEENAANLGIPSHVAKAAFATIRKFATPEEIAEGYLRGIITEEQHDAALRLMGYSDFDISVKKALYWRIPSPTDLIRMAVREVFTPEVAEKFGQYEDFPEVFKELAAKLGISEFWAKAYWAAHWDLPSMTQGFEMFHRRIITEEELKMLLRALDVMPFWRDKLIKLSYNVIPRVDLRRMYTLGILSEEDVYEHYLDLGYKPEDARVLTQWTVRYYGPEDESELEEYRNLTRELIVKAYKTGLINRNEAFSRLVGLKYHENDAELILKLADTELEIEGGTEKQLAGREKIARHVSDAYVRGLMNRGEAMEALLRLNYTYEEAENILKAAESDFIMEGIDDFITGVRNRYIDGVLNRDEAEAALTAANLDAEGIKRLLWKWDMEKVKKSRLLSVSDLRAAFMRGIIDEGFVREELRNLGYDDKRVEVIVRTYFIKKGG
ncbi:MAG: hypothetical protein QXH03_08335 [Candidatus Bathyarchaeia archaeon]